MGAAGGRIGFGNGGGTGEGFDGGGEPGTGGGFDGGGEPGTGEGFDGGGEPGTGGGFNGGGGGFGAPPEMVVHVRPLAQRSAGSIQSSPPEKSSPKAPMPVLPSKGQDSSHHQDGAAS